MKQLRYHLPYLRLILSSLPAVRPRRLLMPAVFFGSWLVFRAVEAPAPTAFVWAAVLAQAIKITSNFRPFHKRLKQIFKQDHISVAIMYVCLVCTLAIQILWFDPLITQRALSLYCLIYVAFMVIGIKGDQMILDHYVHVSESGYPPLGFRYHVLKSYAFVGILTLITNEALIALDTALNTRVITLSLLPITLHYVFEIMVRLAPPQDKIDS